MLMPVLLVFELAADGPVQFHATTEPGRVKVVATPPSRHLPQLPAGAITQEKDVTELTKCSTKFTAVSRAGSRGRTKGRSSAWAMGSPPRSRCARRTRGTHG